MTTKSNILISFFLLVSMTQIYGQDTLFVKKHPFEDRVRNVFNVNNVPYVKTNEKLFKLDSDDNWIEVDLTIKTRYVVFEDGRFLGRDQLIPGRDFDILDQGFFDLLPVRNFHGIHGVVIGNHIYVVAQGSLYQYQIENHYYKLLNYSSVRAIYSTPSSLYVGTYDGLYFADKKLVNYRPSNEFELFDRPKFMNGRIVKHMDKLFLCVDKLLELTPDKTVKDISHIYSFEHGDQRDLVTFGGDLYSLNTKSITRYDSLNKRMITVAKNNVFTTIEVMGNHLYFGTLGGDVFKLSDTNEPPELILSLDSEITDFHRLFDVVYISTFNHGIYAGDTSDLSKAESIFNLNKAVSIISDRRNNIWFGTEEGLFLKPDNTNDLISYIPFIEFNRYAIERIADMVYFGSTSGLYAISGSMAERHLQKKSTPETKSEVKLDRNYIYLALFIISIFFIITIIILKKKRGNDKQRIFTEVDIEEIQQIIISNKIQTVEQLADYYEINTVRLNRLLKKFNQTPGKVLRKAKLKLADEMKEKGETIETISAATGYSSRYLANHWKSSNNN